MHVRRWQDPQALLQHALPYLEVNEDANCVPVGVLHAMRLGGHIWQPDQVFLTAYDARGEAAGFLMRTPPHGAVLAASRVAGAGRALARALRETTSTIPTALGLRETLEPFMAAWSELTGERFEHGYTERLYRCEHVTPPPVPEGRMRAALEADLPLLAAWLGEFHAEALARMPAHDPAPIVRTRTLSAPEVAGMRLWENAAGEPVAMAGYGAPMRHAYRIGPVYTPPAQRGRGFGGAISAALTQELLDRGCAYVLLFADLDYAPSNRVYLRLGYQPVCDLEQAVVAPPEEGREEVMHPDEAGVEGG